MTQTLGFAIFGVDWQLLKPFIVIGLAFGGVYALQGVGLVVLYRATGVLNIAFGAIGAAGALIAYYLVSHTSCPHWLAYTVCVLFGGVVNLAYGMVFGPAFARRDPLVKMMGTLGLALILLGLMAWRAPAGGAFARFLPLPSSQHHYDVLQTSVSLTQIIAIGLAFAITAGSQRLPAGDEARHGDAGDGQRPRGDGHARRPGAAGRGGGLVRLRDLLRDGRTAPPRPAHLARLLRPDLPRDRVARRRADRAAAVALGDALRRSRRGRRSARSSPRWRRRTTRSGARSRSTARQRRSCSRSSRCCTSRVAASSRSPGPTT